MTTTKNLLISALALFFAAQVNAAPILVGEFKPSNGSDAAELAAIRTAINTYNGTHEPDLSQLLGFNADGDLMPINGWAEFVARTTDVSAYVDATGKVVNFTAPGTYLEYYFLSKFGIGGAEFNTALHHLTAGDVLSYNPGGLEAPEGLGHVAIWARGTPSSVPDSGLSIALFGASLMLLGVMKRRMSS